MRSMFRKFLIFLEFANTVLLCYIMMVQTLGAWNTCECNAWRWKGGDYMEWQTAQQTASPADTWGLVVGLILTLVPMGLIMAYLVCQWRLQSVSTSHCYRMEALTKKRWQHLNTENYDDAQRGLRMSRGFRRWSLKVLDPLLLVYHLGLKHEDPTIQRTALRWQYHDNEQPGLPRISARPATSPSIPLMAVDTSYQGTPEFQPLGVG